MTTEKHEHRVTVTSVGVPVEELITDIISSLRKNYDFDSTITIHLSVKFDLNRKLSNDGGGDNT